MTLDLADDYELFDGLETVVFHFLDADGAESTHRIADAALRREVRLDLGGGQMALSDNEANWSIPANKFSRRTPRINDRFTAACDGSTWIIQNIGHATLKSRYRMFCIRER